MSEKKKRTKVVGFRPSDQLLTRMERVAELDNRTVANLIELCVTKHLPIKERELGLIIVDPSKPGLPIPPASSDERSVIAERAPSQKVIPAPSLEKPRRTVAR